MSILRIDTTSARPELVNVSVKSEQLQIRVTPEEKAELRRLARNAGEDVSSYVLARAMPEGRTRFVEILRALGDAEEWRFALAELNDLLSRLTRAQLADVVTVLPGEMQNLSVLVQNYVAAMVELASHERAVTPPSWAEDVASLEEPHFATPLRSLRLHLLRASPVPFKRRNLFVDSSLGARV